MELTDYDFLRYLTNSPESFVLDIIRYLCTAALNGDENAVFGWSTVFQLARRGWIPAVQSGSTADVAQVIDAMVPPTTPMDDAAMNNCSSSPDARLLTH